MILFSEGATKAQEAEANDILEALTVAYPNYPWGVRVYGDSTGGGFFIRHLGLPSNYGMNCTKKFYSSSQLKKEVITAAGEFLERAGLKRGRGNDDEIRRVEGIPEKFQPPSEKPPLAMEVVIDASNRMRDEPMPQVKDMK